MLAHILQALQLTQVQLVHLMPPTRTLQAKSRPRVALTRHPRGCTREDSMRRKTQSCRPHSTPVSGTRKRPRPNCTRWSRPSTRSKNSSRNPDNLVYLQWLVEYCNYICQDIWFRVGHKLWRYPIRPSSQSWHFRFSSMASSSCSLTGSPPLTGKCYCFPSSYPFCRATRPARIRNI